MEGTVKWFNNAKGWGFICTDDGADIFVHYSQIEGDGFRTLRQGEQVLFELKQGPKGQFAEHVHKAMEDEAAQSAAESMAVAQQQL